MQYLQLGIPEPCHEDWNGMKPNEQGRFCNSCVKTVVDFSAMTDAQLMRYFQNLKTENICGRVHTDQLERHIPVAPPARKKYVVYWHYVIAFFMMLGKGPTAKAQGAVQLSAASIPDTSKKPLRPIPDLHPRVGGLRINRVDPPKQADATDSSELLSGKIKAGVAAICIKPETDTLEENADTLLPVMAGGISYRIVTKNVVVDTVQALRAMVSPMIGIAPNPAIPGNMLKLSAKIKKAGMYKVDIIDPSGKLLLQKELSATGKSAEFSFVIPGNWSAGSYFVTLYNDKGLKQGSSGFVITK